MQKPDFSGEWTLNREASALSLDPAPCISGSATYDNAANGVFDGGDLKLVVSASLVNGGLLSYARAAFTDTETPIVTPGCPGSEVSA